MAEHSTRPGPREIQIRYRTEDLYAHDVPEGEWTPVQRDRRDLIEMLDACRAYLTVARIDNDHLKAQLKSIHAERDKECKCKYGS